MKKIIKENRHRICTCLAAFLISFYYLLPTASLAQSTRIWATYYGGAANESNGTIVTDAKGNVYMAGYTDSDSSIAYNGFQNTYASIRPNNDAFLVKFDSSGNRLWATYYGGPANDIGYAVTLDASGENVYLAGYTASISAISSGGFQNLYGGGVIDCFLVKFDSSGNRLWATFYGGTGDEETGFYGCVATDALGNVYLQGFTNSTSGIASGGFQNTFAGGGTGDAFLVKFDSNGNRLWGTYFGGPDDEWGYGMHVDAFGNSYITGRTNSTSGIASGGFQNTFGGAFDAFLVKFDPGGNRVWATYYGGTGDEEGGRAISSDASGNIYLTGYTSSTTGIASGGFQNVFGGVVDVFLVKFAPDGTRIWATYYGGIDTDVGNSLAVDASGNVFLAGQSYSPNGIADGGFQNNLMGWENSYVAEFDSAGNRLCATYYTQGLLLADDGDVRIAVDGFDHVYLMGRTGSPVGIASGGFQNTIGCCIGPFDNYLVKFATCGAVVLPVASFQSSDTTICANECIDYTDLSTNATAWKWSFSGGSPSASTIQNPQNVCYTSPGNYDVKLIAFNSGKSDTLLVSNFIQVFAAPPTPLITKSNDTLFCSTDPTYTSYQWYDDNTLIPGATDTFLVVTHSGNYNVSVSNENGCSIAVGINVVLKAEDLFAGPCLNFSVSPNPAGKELIVRSEKLRIEKIDIYNILGEKVYSHSEITNPKSEISMDVSALAKGVYLVQLSDENKIIYKMKVVKK